jgi:hypothetical protein
MSVTTKSIAPKNNGRATQFGEWVIRWRWFVILFSLLVVAGVGAGASKLYMKNDYRIFFGADNPQLKSFESLQAIYTSVCKETNASQAASGEEAQEAVRILRHESAIL